MRYLRAVALISGLVVLAVEITAFRIVAPFFGNSIFITTNILGVILAALALGYWLGGYVADRTRGARPLYLLMLMTSVLLALIPFVAPLLLTYLRNHISGLDWTLVVLSLVGSALLFFMPFMFLGMVSPWLIRLATVSLEHSGRTAGSLFAWSTLGSLLGTFLPTLLTVPLIGTKRSILLFATLLALVAAFGLVGKRWFLPAAVVAAAALVISPGYFAASPAVLAERESATEYLQVRKSSDGTVELQQDEGIGIHSVYHPTKRLTGLVFDWFGLAPLFRDFDELRLGIIGFAGGTAAQQYRAWFGAQALSIRGVELDPETLQLAHEYFGLDRLADVPLDLASGDGRVWLAQQDQPLDVLIVDAFRQLYIPPHISTREFFSEAREHLSPAGVAVINLNVTSADSWVYRRMAATIRDVFPHVLAVEVPNSYNIVFYASGEPLDLQKLATRDEVPELVPIIKTVVAQAYSIQPDPDARHISTDDRPLTESFYDIMVARDFIGH